MANLRVVVRVLAVGLCPSERHEIEPWPRLEIFITTLWVISADHSIIRLLCHEPTLVGRVKNERYQQLAQKFV